LAAEELEGGVRPGPLACPDLERGPRPRAVEGLGVDAAERRLGVLHARASRDAALEDGERPRRDVPATTAAVAVVAEANGGALLGDRAVLAPAPVRRADGRAEPDLAVRLVQHVVRVLGPALDEALDLV